MKQTLLKWTNPLLGLAVINQAATGMLADDLPPRLFQILHVGGGYLLIALAALHAALNWAWFRSAYRRRSAS